MNLHQLNVFAEASLANTIKVAIVRYLERLYAPLVAQPIPLNLLSYIDRLETMESEQLTAGELDRSPINLRVSGDEKN
jgi:hypothetical protein